MAVRENSCSDPEYDASLCQGRCEAGEPVGHRDLGGRSAEQGLEAAARRLQLLREAPQQYHWLLVALRHPREMHQLHHRPKEPSPRA